MFSSEKNNNRVDAFINIINSFSYNLVIQEFFIHEQIFEFVINK